MENTLKEICVGISERYEIRFIEIGVDDDHIHFLVQSVPLLSVTQIVKTIKSITARQLFQTHPEIKRMLCGGNLWTSVYYINTVGQYASREVIERYVAGQGKYKKLYESQLVFDLGT